MGRLRVRATACLALLIHLVTRPLKRPWRRFRTKFASETSVALPPSEVSVVVECSGKCNWSSASWLSSSGNRFRNRRRAFPFTRLREENKPRISPGTAGFCVVQEAPLTYFPRHWLGGGAGGVLVMNESFSSPSPLFRDTWLVSLRLSSDLKRLLSKDAPDIPPVRRRVLESAPLDTFSLNLLSWEFGLSVSSAESQLLWTPSSGGLKVCRRASGLEHSGKAASGSALGPRSSLVANPLLALLTLPFASTPIPLGLTSELNGLGSNKSDRPILGAAMFLLCLRNGACLT